MPIDKNSPWYKLADAVVVIEDNGKASDGAQRIKVTTLKVPSTTSNPTPPNQKQDLVKPDTNA